MARVRGVIIFSMSDPVHGKRIKEIFESKDVSDREIAEALALIKQTDALDRCREKACDLVQSARQGLQILAPSIYRDSLEALADYVVSRKR